MRWVYGTRTKKWYLVDKTDRDWAHGLEMHIKMSMKPKDAIKLYLSPRAI